MWQEQCLWCSKVSGLTIHLYNTSLINVFSFRYLAKISVYDNNDQAQFVLLGDAGTELTGKPAGVLVDSYFEVTDILLCAYFDDLITQQY